MSELSALAGSEGYEAHGDEAVSTDPVREHNETP